jgi:hypothetical protein
MDLSPDFCPIHQFGTRGIWRESGLGKMSAVFGPGMRLDTQAQIPLQTAQEDKK